MSQIQHGGDIYRNKVRLDFSVNINPLGVPVAVREALVKAAYCCEAYPDIRAEKLTQAIATYECMNAERVICGNGASEIFTAVMHALKPGKIMIPVPSFLGYEKAIEAVNGEIIYYQMEKKDDFRLGENLSEALDCRPDMLILTVPNNPTGSLTEPGLLKRIADKCRAQNTILMLDECFIEFTGQKGFFKSVNAEEYPNVIVVKAFTKLYAIPGVRLGYMLCSDEQLIEKIKTQLPEWNVSVFAQMSGVEALKQSQYREDTIRYVGEQRKWLTEALKKTGMKVYPSEADFIMFEGPAELYDELLKKGILIRDCSNYRGLEKGFYRIAVKSKEDNEELIREINNTMEG